MRPGSKGRAGLGWPQEAAQWVPGWAVSRTRAGAWGSGEQRPGQSIFTEFCNLHFLKRILEIYLFVSALGFCCCLKAFSSCGKWMIHKFHMYST